MNGIIFAALIASGVIFGGRNAFKRWAHRQRMKRNERYNRKIEEAYRRRFKKALSEMGEPETWREDEAAAHRKYQTVEYRTELARQAEAAYLSAGRRF